MSDDDPQPSSSSGANSAAIIAVVIVLPLVYVLSIGPVIYISEKLRITSSVQPVARRFYAPLVWLHDHTPLKVPLDNYEKWWTKVARL